MKILHICSEMYPLIKTGGLADVLGALPYAQQALNNDVRVVLPFYPQVAETIQHEHIELHEVVKINTFAGEITICYVDFHGVGVYLLNAPHLFARVGNPYHNEHYQDYIDNYKRFALLSYIGASLAQGLDPWWGYADVVHAHDWQAGLACAYLRLWQSPVKIIFTIHNIAYVGRFDCRHLPELDLDWSLYNVDGLEFYGEMSYLKAGIYFADVVTTVSPTYAREITEEIAAAGFHGLLKTRAKQGRLVGILNGVDEAIWSPQTDAHIISNYTANNLNHKSQNKTAIQKYFSLPEDKNSLLAVVITRLTEQKGADILLASIESFLEKSPLQLAVLGSGSYFLEQTFQDLAGRFPNKVSVHIGYNEVLSHQMIAGGDLILVPSRFEPCGLTQLYGLAYGTLPLVRKTGGLADTVFDNETGFVFNEPNAMEFSAALQRALDTWKNKTRWQSMQKNAMQQNFSWNKVAEKYLAIYH